MNKNLICPHCGSDKAWSIAMTMASDNSYIDVELDCKVCRYLYNVDYKPVGVINDNITE